MGGLFFEPKQDGVYWSVQPEQLPHADRIELCGRGCSLQVAYGADIDSALQLTLHVIFPTFRTIPNVTEATYQHDVPLKNLPEILVNGCVETQKLVSVFYNGLLRLRAVSDSLTVEHTFFPAAMARAAFDSIELVNTSAQAIFVELRLSDEPTYGRGVKGVYITDYRIDGVCKAVMAPGAALESCLVVSGRLPSEAPPRCDWREDYEARCKRLAELTGPLCLQTGHAALDTLFRLCKIHAAETIFDTAIGPLHSPAGTEYYCGVWTNDQVEYANPWFAYTGDPLAIQSAHNSYRLFMNFMSPTYRAIPTSIVCEGMEIWEEAGDRGDAAMYLYGATRFLLTLSDADTARELLPGVLWCAEYCRLHTGSNGIVHSDSDELEGRFPAGNANLSTNCLCYAGLRGAAYLLCALGEQPARAKEFSRRADDLALAIERYFGAKVSGYDTYRYFEDCELLRSWICWPLCVGLTSRAAETVAALFSPKMFNGEGIVCEEGDGTFWDRSTLYSFRGAFRAGYGALVAEHFLNYCMQRLQGARAPFPVEACPEGDMRHLSGESALFLQVVTEGLLGLEPVGFGSFTLKVQLPPQLPKLRLEGIPAFGSVFDIEAADGCCNVWESGKLLRCFPQGETTLICLKHSR